MSFSSGNPSSAPEVPHTDAPDAELAALDAHIRRLQAEIQRAHDHRLTSAASTHSYTHADSGKEGSAELSDGEGNVAISGGDADVSVSEAGASTAAATATTSPALVPSDVIADADAADHRLPIEGTNTLETTPSTSAGATQADGAASPSNDPLSATSAPSANDVAVAIATTAAGGAPEGSPLSSRRPLAGAGASLPPLSPRFRHLTAAQRSESPPPNPISADGYGGGHYSSSLRRGGDTDRQASSPSASPSRDDNDSDENEDTNDVAENGEESAALSLSVSAATAAAAAYGRLHVMHHGATGGDEDAAFAGAAAVALAGLGVGTRGAAALQCATYGHLDPSVSSSSSLAALNAAALSSVGSPRIVESSSSSTYSSSSAAEHCGEEVYAYGAAEGDANAEIEDDDNDGAEAIDSPSSPLVDEAAVERSVARSAGRESAVCLAPSEAAAQQDPPENSHRSVSPARRFGGERCDEEQPLSTSAKEQKDVGTTQQQHSNKVDVVDDHIDDDDEDLASEPDAFEASPHGSRGRAGARDGGEGRHAIESPPMAASPNRYRPQHSQQQQQQQQPPYIASPYARRQQQQQQPFNPSTPSSQQRRGLSTASAYSSGVVYEAGEIDMAEVIEADRRAAAQQQQQQEEQQQEEQQQEEEGGEGSPAAAGSRLSAGAFSPSPPPAVAVDVAEEEGGLKRPMTFGAITCSVSSPSAAASTSAADDRALSSPPLAAVTSIATAAAAVTAEPKSGSVSVSGVYASQRPPVSPRRTSSAASGGAASISPHRCQSPTGASDVPAGRPFLSPARLPPAVVVRTISVFPAEEAAKAAVALAAAMAAVAESFAKGMAQRADLLAASALIALRGAAAEAIMLQRDRAALLESTQRMGIELALKTRDLERAVAEGEKSAARLAAEVAAATDAAAAAIAEANAAKASMHAAVMGVATPPPAPEETTPPLMTIASDTPQTASEHLATIIVSPVTPMAPQHRAILRNTSAVTDSGTVDGNQRAANPTTDTSAEEEGATAKASLPCTSAGSSRSASTIADVSSASRDPSASVPRWAHSASGRGYFASASPSLPLAHPPAAIVTRPSASAGALSTATCMAMGGSTARVGSEEDGAAANEGNAGGGGHDANSGAAVASALPSRAHSASSRSPSIAPARLSATHAPPPPMDVDESADGRDAVDAEQMPPSNDHIDDVAAAAAGDGAALGSNSCDTDDGLSAVLSPQTSAAPSSVRFSIPNPTRMHSYAAADAPAGATSSQQRQQSSSFAVGGGVTTAGGAGSGLSLGRATSVALSASLYRRSGTVMRVSHDDVSAADADGADAEEPSVQRPEGAEEAASAAKEDAEGTVPAGKEREAEPTAAAKDAGGGRTGTGAPPSIATAVKGTASSVSSRQPSPEQRPPSSRSGSQSTVVAGRVTQAVDAPPPTNKHTVDFSLAAFLSATPSANNAGSGAGTSNTPTPSPSLGIASEAVLVPGDPLRLRADLKALTDYVSAVSERLAFPSAALLTTSATAASAPSSRAATPAPSSFTFSSAVNSKGPQRGAITTTSGASNSSGGGGVLLKEPHSVATVASTARVASLLGAVEANYGDKLRTARADIIALREEKLAAVGDGRRQRLIAQRLRDRVSELEASVEALTGRCAAAAASGEARLRGDAAAVRRAEKDETQRRAAVGAAIGAFEAEQRAAVAQLEAFARRLLLVRAHAAPLLSHASAALAASALSSADGDGDGGGSDGDAARQFMALYGGGNSGNTCTATAAAAANGPSLSLSSGSAEDEIAFLLSAIASAAPPPPAHTHSSSSSYGVGGTTTTAAQLLAAALRQQSRRQREAEVGAALRRARAEAGALEGRLAASAAEAARLSQRVGLLEEEAVALREGRDAARAKYLEALAEVEGAHTELSVLSEALGDAQAANERLVATMNTSSSVPSSSAAEADREREKKEKEKEKREEEARILTAKAEASASAALAAQEEKASVAAELAKLRAQMEPLQAEVMSARRREAAVLKAANADHSPAEAAEAMLAALTGENEKLVAIIRALQKEKEKAGPAKDAAKEKGAETSASGASAPPTPPPPPAPAAAPTPPPPLPSSKPLTLQDLAGDEGRGGSVDPTPKADGSHVSTTAATVPSSSNLKTSQIVLIPHASVASRTADAAAPASSSTGAPAAGGYMSTGFGGRGGAPAPSAAPHAAAHGYDCDEGGHATHAAFAAGEEEATTAHDVAEGTLDYARRRLTVLEDALLRSVKASADASAAGFRRSHDDPQQTQQKANPNFTSVKTATAAAAPPSARPLFPSAADSSFGSSVSPYGATADNTAAAESAPEGFINLSAAYAAEAAASRHATPRHHHVQHHTANLNPYMYGEAAAGPQQLSQRPLSPSASHRRGLGIGVGVGGGGGPAAPSSSVAHASARPRTPLRAVTGVQQHFGHSNALPTTSAPSGHHFVPPHGRRGDGNGTAYYMYEAAAPPPQTAAEVGLRTEMQHWHSVVLRTGEDLFPSTAATASSRGGVATPSVYGDGEAVAGEEERPTYVGSMSPRRVR